MDRQEVDKEDESENNRSCICAVCLPLGERRVRQSAFVIKVDIFNEENR